MSHAATYAVGREKVREYAYAVGESDAALPGSGGGPRRGLRRRRGAADVRRRLLRAGAIGPAILDPEVGIDFARMVHGAQAFTWHEPVVAGDEITTEAAHEDTSERGGLKFFVFTTRSVNQRGELVCEGRWTNIVR